MDGGQKSIILRYIFMDEAFGWTWISITINCFENFKKILEIPNKFADQFEVIRKENQVKFEFDCF